MAEVIAALGVAASVAQLADYGFKLSVKLYTFSEAVYTADKSIRSISNDVSLTSTVLKELCQIIKSDEDHVASEAAIVATQQTVEECLAVFEQLSNALDKSLGNMKTEEIGDGKKKLKRSTVTLEKLKWPFKQPKMELLRCNLDRLKASLTLMLQVLCYARDVSNRKEAESSLAYQKQLIEQLARSERSMKRKYLTLLNAVDNQSYPGISNIEINTAVHMSPDRSLEGQPLGNLQLPNPPILKPQMLVGELLLCFKLLNDLLGYNMNVVKYSNPSFRYENLRSALEEAHQTELKRLEEEYGGASIHIQVEAAENIQARIQGLAKAGYVRKKSIQEDLPLRSKEPDKGASTDKGQKSLIVASANDNPKVHDQTDITSSNSPHGSQGGKHPVGAKYRVVEHVKYQFEGDSESDEMENQSDTNLNDLEQPARRLNALTLAAGVEVEEQNMRINSTLKESDDVDEQIIINRARLNRIGDTVDMVGENIHKVSQRGERMDALSDRSDNLSKSAQEFGRSAYRSRKQKAAWVELYDDVTDTVSTLGGQSYRAIRSLPGLIYEASTALFARSEEDAVIDEHDYQFQNTEQEDMAHRDIVEELLSEWTTLPSQYYISNVE